MCQQASEGVGTLSQFMVVTGISNISLDILTDLNFKIRIYSSGKHWRWPNDTGSSLKAAKAPVSGLKLVQNTLTLAFWPKVTTLKCLLKLLSPWCINIPQINLHKQQSAEKPHFPEVYGRPDLLSCLPAAVNSESSVFFPVLSSSGLEIFSSVFIFLFQLQFPKNPKSIFCQSLLLSLDFTQLYLCKSSIFDH